MLAAFLIGLAGGQRAMTPLAAVSVASARGNLPDDALTRVLGHPLSVASALVLAAAELVGDKLPNAPDRIVAIGLFGRCTTSAIAGAALTPGPSRGRGAMIGGATAVLAAFVGWRARMAMLPRHGQIRTGLVEDALVIACAAAAARWPTHGRRAVTLA